MGANMCKVSTDRLLIPCIKKNEERPVKNGEPCLVMLHLVNLDGRLDMLLDFATVMDITVLCPKVANASNTTFLSWS